MNARLKQMLLITLCLSMIGNAGCTSMQSVNASPEALATKRIDVGDKVTLQYVNGHSENVTLTEIGEESVSGETSDGRIVTVEYLYLLSMDYKKVEVAKTAGAAVGVLAMGVLMVGAVAVGTMAAVAGGM